VTAKMGFEEESEESQMHLDITPWHDVVNGNPEHERPVNNATFVPASMHMVTKDRSLVDAAAQMTEPEIWTFGMEALCGRDTDTCK
jgi:hypothetical protein